MPSGKWFCFGDAESNRGPSMPTSSGRLALGQTHLDPTQGTGSRHKAEGAGLASVNGSKRPAIQKSLSLRVVPCDLWIRLKDLCSAL